MANTRQKNLRRTFRHDLTWEIVLVAAAFFVAPNVHIYLRGSHQEAIESSVYGTASFLAIRLVFYRPLADTTAQGLAQRQENIQEIKNPVRLLTGFLL